jgi:uncharacterized protein YcfJ
MAAKQPINLDRSVAHAVVGLVAGGIVGRKAGLQGFVAAAVITVMAHVALDSPLAGLVAEVA